MVSANIAYAKKNGVVKSVHVDSDGEIDALGVELIEYFSELSNVKSLVVSSISTISDGDVEYLDDIDGLTEEQLDFIEYEDEQDYIDDMNPSLYYYLYKNLNWTVCKPNQSEFKDLETILNEEF
jgi:hypothetical protein